MSIPELTRAHRADLEQLTGLAAQDLSLIWAEFNSATVARDGLLDVLPRLVAAYGSAAAALGADWYDEMRDAVGVGGSFAAIPAELPDQGRTDALARWGVTPLFAAEPDWASALTLVTGGLARVVANADRQSVAISSEADPKADGWQRAARGGACAFCMMLAGRGDVYSEATADFASHDHCHCIAVAAFTDRPRPVQPFTPSARESSDADRARVRAWLAANPQQ